MTEITPERIADAYGKALADVTSPDLAALVPHIERFGMGGELDAVVITARPGAKVQRRFLPRHAQGDIFRAALRTAKAQDLVQDTVIGLYADVLGDAVEDPSLEQLREATTAVLEQVAAPLVVITLLGVVYRQDLAAPHAVVVLREQFAVDLAA